MLRLLTLVQLEGPTSNLAFRARLVDVTSQLGTSDGYSYCRAVVVDATLPQGKNIVFWNVGDVLYEQIKSSEGRCCEFVQTSTAPAREGHMDRGRYVINFNGGTPNPRNTPISRLTEIREDPSFPRGVPVVGVEPTPSPIRLPPVPLCNPQPTPHHSSSQLRQPPRELCEYECLRCGFGTSPTCGATGLPHPNICERCGMLEAPVVAFCPMTGQPHPGSSATTSST